MNRYRYKAIKPDGKYVSGKLAANNPAQLMSILKESSLELVSYSQDKVKAGGFFNKINSNDLVAMFIQLEQLEKAGVPIIEAISDLKDSSDSVKVRNVMHEVYESIKSGSLFSEGLAKRPDVFSSTYIGLIAMGEKTGNLSTSFSSIVEDIKWNNDIKRKTKKAITGPIFGLIMMFVVLGVMTTIVVPKVTSFLTAQSINLPMATVSLIAFSDFMKKYWLIMLLFFPAIWFIIKILSTSQGFATKVDDVKLKLPIFGSIITKIESAKFCQFFAMTFRSGLGVLDCLESSSVAIKNKAIRQSILNVKKQVSDGKKLADAISSTGYFPSLVVRMFKVGEDTGNMDGSLKNIKFFYDREINDSIDKLVGMIQPTITLIMGGMIGWISIAVFGPIYGTFSNLK